MTDPLSVARQGLPQTEGPRRSVLVLGAGMAGLVAAYELRRAGHRVRILEARVRPGGRVHTLRAPFSPGLYGEAGAMRIPAAHALTRHYVDHFGLELEPFTLTNDRAFYLLQEERIRFGEVRADPRRQPYTYEERARGVTIDRMWQDTVAPLVAAVRRNADEGIAALRSAYGEHSLQRFLEEQGWSDDAIELYGLLGNHETEMGISVLEILREELDDDYRRLFQIRGGMDRLPLALFAELRDELRFGAIVKAIEQDAQGVSATYQTDGGTFTERADAMICTLPFSVLRHIDTTPAFSREKRRAIRALHYHASGKIFLQSSRRFWEEDEGIDGGASITDLPIRSVYYPEHGQQTGRGVLLASYTMGEDALRWSALTTEERIREAVDQVARIHPQMPAAFEAGASVMWHDDPRAGGAYAFFEPGQETQLAAACAATEGRVHFAGEHTSRWHAWIQGAIESALRAAAEVNGA